ncbi:MAG: hypothetical protein A2583_10760 [Bdellovibrionales bacterium RIFOXYD1_FULL_53_11]|nr:MAG: hypothetical protein A2583_10760 [Bdellovibrionales bacterium RIFOXYD1_FULL_53_11]
MLSFLDDALRMSNQATQYLDGISKGAQSARDLDQPLYRIVHTIKSTATMIRGAEAVVRALHDFEASFSASARGTGWLASARKAIGLASRQLREIRERSTLEAGGEPDEGMGLLAQAEYNGVDMRVWFPLSCVLRVVAPQEIEGRKMLCVRGEWVPVLRTSPSEAKGYFGIALEFRSRRYVLAVSDVDGLEEWNLCLRRGVLLGTALLDDAVRTIISAGGICGDDTDRLAA